MRRKIHDFGPVALGWAVLIVFGVVASGCATAPPPIQLLDRAQSEIHAARSAGAANTAPEVLAEAERRLAAAQQFTANNDNGKATDKAEEAEAAAATAHARADAARLDNQIQQQTQVNAQLQADLKRRQAAAAAAQQAAVAPLPVPAAATSSAPPASTASNAAPASAASAATPAASPDNGPVTLPSIELGQPATPPSASGTPASASTAGSPNSGGNP